MNVSACYAMMLVIWFEVGPAGGMFEIVSDFEQHMGSSSVQLIVFVIITILGMS